MPRQLLVQDWLNATGIGNLGGRNFSLYVLLCCLIFFYQEHAKELNFRKCVYHFAKAKGNYFIVRPKILCSIVKFKKKKS